MTPHGTVQISQIRTYLNVTSSATMWCTHRRFSVLTGILCCALERIRNYCDCEFVRTSITTLTEEYERQIMKLLIKQFPPVPTPLSLWLQISSSEPCSRIYQHIFSPNVKYHVSHKYERTGKIMYFCLF